VVDREVAGDGKEPGLEGLSFVVAVYPGHHFEPRLLEKVFGQGGVSCEPHQVAEQPIPVAVEERVEGVRVSAAEPRGLAIRRRHPQVRSDDP